MSWALGYGLGKEGFGKLHDFTVQLGLNTCALGQRFST